MNNTLFVLPLRSAAIFITIIFLCQNIFAGYPEIQNVKVKEYVPLGQPAGVYETIVKLKTQYPNVDIRSIQKKDFDRHRLEQIALVDKPSKKGGTEKSGGSSGSGGGSGGGFGSLRGSGEAIFILLIVIGFVVVAIAVVSVANAIYDIVINYDSHHYFGNTTLQSSIIGSNEEKESGYFVGVSAAVGKTTHKDLMKEDTRSLYLIVEGGEMRLNLTVERNEENEEIFENFKITDATDDYIAVAVNDTYGLIGAGVKVDIFSFEGLAGTSSKKAVSLISMLRSNIEIPLGSSVFMRLHLGASYVAFKEEFGIIRYKHPWNFLYGGSLGYQF